MPLAPSTWTPSADDRLFAIAPHPDDDALACGGTLALAARAGAAVRVAYLTDGGASHPGSLRFPRAALRDVREGEALAGLAALGLAPETALFFRALDGALEPYDRVLTETLAGALASFAPTVLLAPFERDAHPDHRAAAVLAARALDAAELGSVRVLRYAVWLDHRGDAAERPRRADGRPCLVDTTSVLREKRRAIAAHRSQFGRTVRDDPNGFRLPHALVRGACAPNESFLEARAPEDPVS